MVRHLRSTSFVTEINALTSSGESSKNLRILVVEDDETSREMMAELLHLFGNHAVDVAETGEDGLEHLRAATTGDDASSYDLIFTDVGLPGMSGLEMLDEAVKCGLIHPANVIVCSAYMVIAREVAARGAQCIPKPVDAAKIKAAVLARCRADAV